MLGPTRRPKQRGFSSELIGGCRLFQEVWGRPFSLRVCARDSSLLNRPLGAARFHCSHSSSPRWGPPATTRGGVVRPLQDTPEVPGRGIGSILYFTDCRRAKTRGPLRRSRRGQDDVCGPPNTRPQGAGHQPFKLPELYYIGHLTPAEERIMHPKTQGEERYRQEEGAGAEKNRA